MRSEEVAIDFECIAVGIRQACAEIVFTPEGRWNTQVGGPCLDGRAGFHAEAEVKCFARAYRLTLHEENGNAGAEQLVASDLEVQAVGVPLCKNLGIAGRYAEGGGPTLRYKSEFGRRAHASLRAGCQDRVAQEAGAGHWPHAAGYGRYG